MSTIVCCMSHDTAVCGPSSKAALVLLAPVQAKVQCSSAGVHTQRGSQLARTSQACGQICDGVAPLNPVVRHRPVARRLEPAGRQVAPDVNQPVAQRVHHALLLPQPPLLAARFEGGVLLGCGGGAGGGKAAWARVRACVPCYGSCGACSGARRSTWYVESLAPGVALLGDLLLAVHTHTATHTSWE
jgi:hypothetical protein